MPVFDWVRENDRCVMGSIQNLGLVGWRNAPTVDDVRRWRSLAHAVGHAHGGQAACIDLVRRGKPDFSEATRAEVNLLAADPKVFPLGIAHVIALDGLAGAAVRAFISTVLLVARTAAPAKVFGARDPATAWLQPKLHAREPWTREEVRAAYDALYERLGA
jgi:hypothetical protein